MRSVEVIIADHEVCQCSFQLLHTVVQMCTARPDKVGAVREHPQRVPEMRALLEALPNAHHGLGSTKRRSGGA